ncbi:MAG TPA: sugar phosphate isomerase/epimerase [Bryobacteraceae bacterium]|nr:sugar phosphate isomerase/epimerase [Bryobacteraceae bacterium]
MLYTRRDIGRIALAAGAAAKLRGAEKPNSNFNGVQIGAITYSYRQLPNSNDAHQVLQYVLDSNISAIELMGPVAESFAGAPSAGRGGFGGGQRGPGGTPGGPGGPSAGANSAAAGEAPAGGGQGQGRGRGGRAPLTPEQQAAQQRAAEDLKKWRLSASMDKYKEFRKLYNDAGVSVYAYKLEPRPTMSDEEYDYIFNVAETLGASHVTLELSNDEKFLKRIGDFAAKRHMLVAYHAHTQASMTAWDTALELSPGNAINLDCGHYFAGTGESPIPLILKRHDRIASMHLKDRRKQGTPGGDNLPWGKGDTPIKEILQTVRDNKYPFPASIEYEYQTPEGSDVLTEMRKCVQYCKDALA